MNALEILLDGWGTRVARLLLHRALGAAISVMRILERSVRSRLRLRLRLLLLRLGAAANGGSQLQALIPTRSLHTGIHDLMPCDYCVHRTGGKTAERCASG